MKLYSPMVAVCCINLDVSLISDQKASIKTHMMTLSRERRKSH